MKRGTILKLVAIVSAVSVTVVSFSMPTCVQAFDDCDALSEEQYECENGEEYIAAYDDAVCEASEFLGEDIGWEKESNNTAGEANVISINKHYIGNISSEADADWFKLTTPSNGVVTFNLKPAAGADMSHILWGWNMYIYSENDTVNALKCYEHIVSSNFPGLFPFKKGTFYVKIVKCDAPPVGCNYDFSTTFSAKGSWEKEFNDTREQATALASKGSIKGTMLSKLGASDIDWYKVKMKSTGSLVVDLAYSKDSPSDNVGIYGWTVVVYDSRLNELGQTRQITNKGNVTVAAKKGTYYIKVCKYADGADDVVYELKTRVAPYKPTLKSVKVNKRKATLKWKKVSGAKGYYVYRRDGFASEFKKIKNIKGGSKVTYTDKKLQLGRIYTYRICAYGKSGKTTLVGAFSNEKDAAVNH